MSLFGASSHAHRGFPLVRELSVALLCGALFPGHGSAQTAPAKTSTNSTSSSAPSKDGSAALGFSIESEMLTYRALQSNSEAVACDIAAYLNSVEATFTTSAAGSKCSVKPSPKSTAGIVLLPFDQNVIEGQQLWRADLEIMNQLRQRAIVYCPDTPQIEVHDRGAASAALDLTPAGSALTLAQGVVGMVASQSDTSPVEGTIEDQAFLNTVARQLRVLGLSVVTPNVYHPYTLNGLDEAKSPFLASFEKFLTSHDCMQGKDATKDAVLGEILGEMNTFLNTLNGNTPPASKPNVANANSDSITTTTQTQSFASSSGLVAILAADGLAQKLGVDLTTGKLPDDRVWQHILFVKALESGGSVSRESNIFGTKIRYSGGAVGTYELVTMDGEVECSGNVFDFGGSVKAKNFERDLGKYTPNAASQLIFQRGGCSVATKP